MFSEPARGGIFPGFREEDPAPARERDPGSSLRRMDLHPLDAPALRPREGRRPSPDLYPKRRVPDPARAETGT
ncbi:hypothetical protein Skr01_13140 [Sphaerisporangium krabiense]|nr:hypothetical protein Skr01_13140 [Sphaerisporangium krabiense]